MRTQFIIAIILGIISAFLLFFFNAKGKKKGKGMVFYGVSSFFLLFCLFKLKPLLIEYNAVVFQYLVTTTIICLIFVWICKIFFNFSASYPKLVCCTLAFLFIIGVSAYRCCTESISEGVDDFLILSFTLAFIKLLDAICLSRQKEEKA